MPGINVGAIFDGGRPRDGSPPMTFQQLKALLDAHLTKGFTRLRVPVRWAEVLADAGLSKLLGDCLSYSVATFDRVVVGVCDPECLSFSSKGVVTAGYAQLLGGVCDFLAPYDQGRLVVEALSVMTGPLGNALDDLAPDPASPRAIADTREVNRVGYSIIAARLANASVQLSTNNISDISQLALVYPTPRSLPSLDRQRLVMGVSLFDPMTFCDTTGTNGVFTIQANPALAVQGYLAKRFGLLGKWMADTGMRDVCINAYGVGRKVAASRQADVVKEYYRQVARMSGEMGVDAYVWDDRAEYAVSCADKTGKTVTYIYGLADCVLSPGEALSDSPPQQPAPSSSAAAAPESLPLHTLA